MINVSTAFKQKLYRDERDYLNTLQFTLTDNTQLTVDNEHILGGGLEFEDAVGEDNSFTALGSTVCNGLTVTLYNLDDIYSDYIFEGARCIWYTGLNVPSGNSEAPEMIKKGVFTVDSATYDDYTITLTLLDNMEQFDRPYSMSQLAYPATLDEIVRNACSICDVTLDTNSLDFPNKNYSVATRPEDGSTTFREVLGWCATIAGCFARCNVDGKLELKWFDIASFENETGYDGGVFDSANPYATGDSVDGGSFNPWNDGTSVEGGAFTDNIPFHYITSLNTQSIGVDDITITGVKIVVKVEEENSSSTEQEFIAGSSKYVIEVSENPFITVDTVQSVLNFLATQLIGTRFRQCNVTHPSDPTIEAGDVGLIWDTRGNEHPILITRVTFAPDQLQTVVCGAETVSKNQSTRVSFQTKSYIDARRQLRNERNAYQAAMNDLRESIENAAGLYETDVVQQDSSVIRYLHNKPNLEESDIQIVISDVGITMTPDGGDHWYGLQVDGTLIASIMNTIGINFDWGTGGTLTLGGSNNTNGWIKILDASGTEIGRWTKDGIEIKAGSINLGNGNFVVTNGGSITAKSGSINIGNGNFVVTTSGAMTSKSGQIANFSIKENYLIYNLANNGTHIPSMITYEDNRLYLGKRGFINSDTSSNSSSVSNAYLNERKVQITEGQLVFGRYYPGMIMRNQSGNITDFTNHWKFEMVQATNSSGTSTRQVLVYNGSSNSYDELKLRTDDVDVKDNLFVHGDSTVSGTKSRFVSTKDYGDRLLYCYETPSPIFGDIGEGVIGEDGLCYVNIDSIFSETINTYQYQVFLQKYGNGECFVRERNSLYFVVQGTPKLSFGWELKAKQADYTQKRLNKFEKRLNIANEIDYALFAEGHIQNIYENRGLNI